MSIVPTIVVSAMTIAFGLPKVLDFARFLPQWHKKALRSGKRNTLVLLPVSRGITELHARRTGFLHDQGFLSRQEILAALS